MTRLHFREKSSITELAVLGVDSSKSSSTAMLIGDVENIVEKPSRRVWLSASTMASYVLCQEQSNASDQDDEVVRFEKLQSR